jgi:hypothetical protein
MTDIPHLAAANRAHEHIAVRYARAGLGQQLLHACDGETVRIDNAALGRTMRRKSLLAASGRMFT